MMNQADGIARFFKNSPKRQLALERAIEEYSVAQKRTKLKEMCRTRWVERHDAFQIFLDLYVPVVRCLEDMCRDNSQNWNRDTQKDASSYFFACTRFQFIITLVITSQVMSYSKTLCVSLQARGTDVIKAYRHVNLVKKSLMEVRDKIDDFSAKYFEEARKLADKVGVTASSPRNAIRMEHRTNTPADTVEQYYKRNVAIPLIDHLVTELDSRFPGQAQKATETLKLIPSTVTINDVNCIKDSCIEMYKEDAELHMWCRKWQDTPAKDCPETAATTLKQIDSTFNFSQTSTV